MSTSSNLPELASLLEGFLRQWLPREKGASPHTRAAYATSLKLLLNFAARRHRCAPAQLTLEQLDAPCVLAFLAQLETARGNGPRTRNARLAAIKSFATYLEGRRPDALAQILAIRAIPTKRFDLPLLAHLEPDEQRALLGAVPTDSRLGLRDRAMTLIGLDLGLRASELLGLSLADVQLASPAQVLIHGKGRREAKMPLSQRAYEALQAWLDVRGKVATDRIFLNHHHRPLSPRGFQGIVKKYAAQAARNHPSLAAKTITPHSLRHTCAMDTLNANNHDIRKVALWLRHASPQTTEMYVRADPAKKLQLPHGNHEPSLQRGTFKPSDKVLDILRAAARPNDYANCPNTG